MREEKTAKYLEEYNSLVKKEEGVYRDAIKALEMSECAFWILYILYEQKGVRTQSEICDLIYQPKQTVNSALKKMETEGYIELRNVSDKRSKRIYLTDKGEKLAGNTVEKVMDAERAALLEFTEEEMDCFLTLFRRYTTGLKEKMKELKKEK